MYYEVAKLMHKNSRKKLPNSASFYLNLICIYLGTEHKNYKRSQKMELGTIEQKNYHLINLN